MGEVVGIGQTSDVLAVIDSLREGAVNGQINCLLTVQMGDDLEPFISIANPGLPIHDLIGAVEMLKLHLWEIASWQHEDDN